MRLHCKIVKTICYSDMLLKFEEPSLLKKSIKFYEPAVMPVYLHLLYDYNFRMSTSPDSYYDSAIP